MGVVGLQIRHKKRQPDIVPDNTGLTDHPDRAFDGGWLTFEDGNDPRERSKPSMIDMWKEWGGMREVVAEQEALEATAA